MTDSCSPLLRALIAEVAELKTIVHDKVSSSGRLYSTKEIQDLTGLGKTALVEGMADGRYQVFRHGRAVRLDLEQVRQAMRKEGTHGRRFE